MQVTFTFSDKNDESDKLLVDDSNYSDDNKLSVNDGNYLHNNKLPINDDNTFGYGGDVRMGNYTETPNTTSKNNFTPLVFSIIS